MKMSKTSLVTAAGVTCAVIVLALWLCGWIWPLSATKSMCMRNLNIIQEAKVAWMNENNKTLNDTPRMEDLKYLFGSRPNDVGWLNGVPMCPQGRHYILGRVGESARCSIGGIGHSLNGSVF
jgi:hypothetical protein